MNPTAGEIIDSLARRIRDPNNTAHSRDLVRDLLDRVQVLINAKTEFVTETQTLVTTPGKAVYAVPSQFGNLVQVTDIDHDECSINFIANWTDLWKLNPRWLSDPKPSPEGWARIGRTLLVIYPAPSQQITLRVTGIKRTTELVDDNSMFEFETHQTDLIREAVFSILLWRQEDADTSSAALQSLAGRMEVQGIDLTVAGTDRR